MHPFTWRFFALGSDCTLHIFSESKADAGGAAAAAMSEIGRIEVRYSRYRAESEASRINAIAKSGGTAMVDSETAGLLEYGLRMPLALTRKCPVLRGLGLRVPRAARRDHPGADVRPDWSPHDAR
jgi:hypothetical protein